MTEHVDMTPPTEAQLFHLLKKRYQPPAWVLMPGVRDSTGANASRTADGLAMGTWPSRGLELIGFEIKSHRNDWLRELKAPGKAEPIAQFCDRWLIVAASDDIVKLEELPTGWGLLVARGKRGLVSVKEAPMLTPKPITRRFLAAIMRAAHNHLISSDEIREAVSEAREQTRKLAAEQAERSQKHLQSEIKELQATVTEFNEGLGLEYPAALQAYYHRHSHKDLGKAVRFVLDGGMKTMQRELRTTHERLLKMTKEVEALMTPDPPEKVNNGSPPAETTP